MSPALLPSPSPKANRVQGAPREGPHAREKGCERPAAAQAVPLERPWGPPSCSVPFEDPSRAGIVLQRCRGKGRSQQKMWSFFSFFPSQPTHPCSVPASQDYAMGPVSLRRLVISRQKKSAHPKLPCRFSTVNEPLLKPVLSWPRAPTWCCITCHTARDSTTGEHPLALHSTFTFAIPQHDIRKFPSLAPLLRRSPTRCSLPR